jgi:hypothetical protein
LLPALDHAHICAIDDVGEVPAGWTEMLKK